MTQRKLSYIWMAVGVAFGLVGITGLLSGHLTALLTLAVAGLIIYTSIFHLGGWPNVKHDIKLFWIANKPSRPSRAEKKRSNFRVIKK